MQFKAPHTNTVVLPLSKAHIHSTLGDFYQDMLVYVSAAGFRLSPVSLELLPWTRHMDAHPTVADFLAVLSNFNGEYPYITDNHHFQIIHRIGMPRKKRGVYLNLSRPVYYATDREPPLLIERANQRLGR